MNNTNDKDMYMLLGEIRSDVKALREAREHGNMRMDALESMHRARETILEDRISKLESFRYKIAGVTVVLGFCSPLIMFLVQRAITNGS